MYHYLNQESSHIDDEWGHPVYHPMVHPMYHPMYHYLNQESSDVEQGEEKVDRRDLLAKRARAADADADDLASGKGYGGYKFKGYKKVGKAYKKAFKGWHLNQESSDVKKEEAAEGEEKVDSRDLLAKRAGAADADADDLASGKGYGGYKFKGYKKVGKAYKKASKGW